jgi:isocitrate dehydrogenase
MMLVHIGQGEVAARIQKAWLKTIEDGMHTGDIFNEEHSKKNLSTSEFTQEVISRLKQKPLTFKPVNYPNTGLQKETKINEINTQEVKTLVGVDIVLNWNKERPVLLANEIMKLVDGSELGLQIISVKGLKAWPEVGDITIKSDEWSLRFVPTNKEKLITHDAIIKLLSKLSAANYDFTRINNLYLFDKTLGFSLAQGE